MERNANDSIGGVTGQTGATNAGMSAAGGGSTAGDFGTTSGTSGGAGASTGGATTGGGNFGGSSVGSAAGSQGYAGGGMAGDTSTGSRLDAAKDKLAQGKGALGDRLGTVKEKAGQLSATLADRLEAGAEKLRQRGQGQQFAGTDGQTVAASNDQMSAMTNRLAGGLQGTADFLREGDFQGSIEKQVREHPARTLLVAAGLGYFIGKALKK